jgi:16S rRNA (adenine1518-N6/adenine1519-N6)-dimethyltransferase
VSLDALPPLREGLAAHGLDARKAFGQHFLLDLNLTGKIARLAGPFGDGVVIEVGPGPGGLTRALLQSGAHVIAIERDPRFAPMLAELAEAADGRLTVIQADALSIGETHLVPAGTPVRIVANLPYNISAPLLIKWLTGPLHPVSMTLMFQKEVADRIVAAPNTPAYGRLAVIAQAVCEAESVMALPARAFTPPPKVDSAVVRFTPRPERPPDAVLAALQRVTAAAFGQRRKMLRSSLKAVGGALLWEAAGVDPNLRAEAIGVGDFLALARAAVALNGVDRP